MWLGDDCYMHDALMSLLDATMPLWCLLFHVVMPTLQLGISSSLDRLRPRQIAFRQLTSLLRLAATRTPTPQT